MNPGQWRMAVARRARPAVPARRFHGSRCSESRRSRRIPARSSSRCCRGIDQSFGRRRSHRRSRPDRADLRRARRRCGAGAPRHRRIAQGRAFHCPKAPDAGRARLRDPRAERAKRDDKPTYVVRFRSPIPDGRVAVLRLKLSDEAGPTIRSSKLRRAPRPFRSATRRLRPWLERRPSRRRPAMQRARLDTMRRATRSRKAVALPIRQAAKRRLKSQLQRRSRGTSTSCARDAPAHQPAVDDLAVEQDGSVSLTALPVRPRLRDFAQKQGALVDDRKRPLAESWSQKFAFKADAPAISWDAGSGIVERLGPQFLPLRGRGGYDRADVRIHRIDPLSRATSGLSRGRQRPTIPDAAPALPAGAGHWIRQRQCGRRRHRRASAISARQRFLNSLPPADQARRHRFQSSASI